MTEQLEFGNTNLTKSNKALKTIGEISQELDIQQHVIRFWETKFPQITPQKIKNRRYYNPENLEIIAQIKDLLYTKGYTIKGVQAYLKPQKTPSNFLQEVTLSDDSSELVTSFEKEELHNILVSLKAIRIKLEIAVAG